MVMIQVEESVWRELHARVEKAEIAAREAEAKVAHGALFERFGDIMAVEYDSLKTLNQSLSEQLEHEEKLRHSAEESLRQFGVDYRKKCEALDALQNPAKREQREAELLITLGEVTQRLRDSEEKRRHQGIALEKFYPRLPMHVAKALQAYADPESTETAEQLSAIVRTALPSDTMQAQHADHSVPCARCGNRFHARVDCWEKEPSK